MHFLGTAIGLAAAFATTRFLESILYGVAPTDPFTFVTVPLVLTLAALVGSSLPALRALRIRPQAVLRQD